MMILTLTLKLQVKSRFERSLLEHFFHPFYVLHDTEYTGVYTIWHHSVSVFFTHYTRSPQKLTKHQRYVCPVHYALCVKISITTTSSFLVLVSSLWLFHCFDERVVFVFFCFYFPIVIQSLQCWSKYSEVDTGYRL